MKRATLNGASDAFQQLTFIELLLLGGMVLVAVAVIPIWIAAQLAALLATGHVHHLALMATLHALTHWHGSLGDPRMAFPMPARQSLPGPLTMYGSALVVLVGIGAIIVSCARVTRRRPRPGFATRHDLRGVLTPRKRGRKTSPVHGAIFLGRDSTTGQQLFGSAEDSYLYLGPPRCGKGVHLIIPQTIDAAGPVLVTATRPDTLRHTIALREKRGLVAVFDPQELAGRVPRLRWAPQDGCADALTAISRARALAAGAHFANGAVTDATFWQTMTEAVLRCYLHAAALDGANARDLTRWSQRPTDPAPIRILRTAAGAAPGWAEELNAQAAADPRQRDSVWAGVRRALDSLADPRVLDACCPPASQTFDVDELLDGGTIYLLGSTGAQLSVAPLITALVEALVDAARRRAATFPDGRLTPALTLLLDEAANIAPIPSLPNLLADGGGSGITTVCVLQSLAQARARWGQAGADAVWDASTVKVVLGGLAQADDLSRISKLLGETDEPVRTRSHGPEGGSMSTAPRRMPVLSLDALRCLPVGHGIVLARRTPPVEALLTPWWLGPHADEIRAALPNAAPIPPR